MKTVQGDLIKLARKGQFDVIVHGCNCFCTMGAGIALTIKKRFPEAYEADLATAKGDQDKLGTFSSAVVSTAHGQLTVVNGYTQFNFRGRGRKADYEAIRSVFRLVKEEFSGKRIGFPAIGAGLAGGNWKVIAQIISEELEGEDFTFVEYRP